LDIREDNYAPFLHGIIAACRESSIKLEIGYASDPSESELAGLRASANVKQGVIISGRIGDKDIEEITRQGIPFVVLGNYRLSRRVHMVGIDILDAAERVIEDAVAKGVRSFSVVVEDARRPFDREILRCIRGTLLDFGIPAGDEIIIEAGRGFSNIVGAADQVLAQGQKNSCVLTLEQHCADQLVMELHSRPPEKSKSINIVSFVANTHRVRSRHYRIFGLSHDLCGRIAVARLMEIAANPGFPPHMSAVASPGWVEPLG
jgi:DNA-binding LacI/PurR family transcriptional regulator